MRFISFSVLTICLIEIKTCELQMCNLYPTDKYWTIIINMHLKTVLRTVLCYMYIQIINTLIYLYLEQRITCSSSNIYFFLIYNMCVTFFPCLFVCFLFLFANHRYHFARKTVLGHDRISWKWSCGYLAQSYCWGSCMVEAVRIECQRLYCTVYYQEPYSS